MGSLIHAQHKHLKHLKKLDKNIFMREHSHRLGWVSPVSLVTKEILCFKSSRDSLSVVRVSHPEEGASSVTTYLNSWETVRKC